MLEIIDHNMKIIIGLSYWPEFNYQHILHCITLQYI